MKASIKCFGCKTKYDVDLQKEQVTQTKNSRYVANVKCETCGRKMTSLVKREAYESLQVSKSTEEQ